MAFTTGKGAGAFANWGAQALIVRTIINRNKGRLFFILSPLEVMTDLNK